MLHESGAILFLRIIPPTPENEYVRRKAVSELVPLKSLLNVADGFVTNL